MTALFDVEQYTIPNWPHENLINPHRSFLKCGNQVEHRHRFYWKIALTATQRYAYVAKLGWPRNEKIKRNSNHKKGEQWKKGNIDLSNSIFHLYAISFTRCLHRITLKNIQMMRYIKFYLFYTILVINVPVTNCKNIRNQQHIHTQEHWYVRPFFYLPMKFEHLMTVQKYDIKVE